MSIESKFPWSFSGFLIGMIALIVSVIIFYYTESKDKFDLKLVIEDEFNLIELKDELQDLKILYKDENILAHNKEIKIIIYSFTNDGKLIIQDYYDRNKAFAIEFDSSKVLSTKVISSNSEYLRKDFLIDIKDSSNETRVDFSKLIFESGKKITLKSYLIQDKGIQNTKIRFVGKIAGIDEFKIIRKTDEVEKKQSLDKSLTKFVIWFSIIYVGLIFVLIIISKIKDRVERKRFEKTWSSFVTLFPSHKFMKEKLEKIKFSPRLKRITIEIIEGKNILDIGEYIAKRKSFSPLEFIFGRRNWISFPSDIFIIEKGLINIKPDLLSFYNDYYDFNKKEF
jgi:hypothetical protein